MILLDREVSELLSFNLKNTVTLKEHLVAFTPLMNYKFCIVIQVDLSSFPQGEYEYTLLGADNKVAGKGLILLGEYQKPETSLNTNLTYKCYGE